MTEEPVPRKLCFVVGPIGADDSPARIHADWLLETIIQPVMAEFSQFETRRADQITQPGMIDAQIINALLNADLVIADLSSLNPNVFYEIGIRHMAQKPIIHMQLDEENIPFDVSLYRAIKFSRTHPRDLRAARDSLKSQVQAVISDGYQVENPVTRTRGLVALEQGATSGEKVLLQQIRAIEVRLRILEVANSRQGVVLAASEPPRGSTLLTFISKKSRSSDQFDKIFKAMSDRFWALAKVSQTSTEMTIALPGNINLNDLKIPPEILEDVEVISTRPFDS